MERSSLDPLRAAVAAVAIHQKLISHATPLVFVHYISHLSRGVLGSYGLAVLKERIRPRDAAITLPLGMH